MRLMHGWIQRGGGGAGGPDPLWKITKIKFFLAKIVSEYDQEIPQS